MFLFQNVPSTDDGTEKSPCSDIYGGTGPASEPEVQAIQAEAQALRGNLTAWLTLHTAGHMWAFPYGHTLSNGRCKMAGDYEELVNVIYVYILYTPVAAQLYHTSIW